MLKIAKKLTLLNTKIIQEKKKLKFMMYVDFVVKVKDHFNCHVTGKCKGVGHIGYNINVSLTYENPIVCHNLKNYDAHLIIQELDQFYFEIKLITERIANIYKL